MADVEEQPAEAASEYAEGEEAPEGGEFEEEEDEFVPVAGNEIKLFGKWSFDEIEVRDISLEVCILRFLLNDW